MKKITFIILLSILFFNPICIFFGAETTMLESARKAGFEKPAEGYCPSCNKNIVVDLSFETSQCPYCDNIFISTKAVEKDHAKQALPSKAGSLSTSTNQQVKQKNLLRIAILPFLVQPYSRGHKAQANIMYEYFNTNLLQSGKFDIISSFELDNALNKLNNGKIYSNNNFDLKDSDIKKLGELLNVDFVIMGKVEGNWSGRQYSFKLIDAKNGTTFLNVESKEGPHGDTREAYAKHMDKICNKIITALNDNKELFKNESNEAGKEKLTKFDIGPYGEAKLAKLKRGLTNTEVETIFDGYKADEVKPLTSERFIWLYNIPDTGYRFAIFFGRKDAGVVAEVLDFKVCSMQAQIDEIAFKDKN